MYKNAQTIKLKEILLNTSPQLKKRILYIAGFITLINTLVWLSALYLSPGYPILLGLVYLAFGLGVRHAVDADHIAAIDNATRKLIQDGQKPIAVGFFFALGHSTIVMLLVLSLAFSSGFIINNLPQFMQIGSLIGSLVSSIFLLGIGIINLIIFINLYKIWRHVGKKGYFQESHIDEHLHNRGLIAKFLKPLLKTVSHSWSMYPIGLLFGLGFDTASQIALLSLSAISATQNLPSLYVLLLPLAFTAGMALIDTLNGIFMLGAYGWGHFNPISKLYYNLNVTFMSVFIALFIGTIEALQVISRQTNFKTGIFFYADQIELNYLGYIIICAFILSLIFSRSLYRFKKYDSIIKQHRH